MPSYIITVKPETSDSELLKIKDDIVAQGGSRANSLLTRFPPWRLIDMCRAWRLMARLLLSSGALFGPDNE
ncbi:unnamed protein product [Tuber melanosporum]|uniref:(Perigord truffle) hypothetical protein n=1 Tax=Tuber melanosporum (strain Mel28) TaxID=656061 RepID=D5GEQ9_TUBMM|nr:uncharacterized protein GSTUM_00001336001 [Tuber melanosporum]CAZ83002.1 unnamed protein product [Tuber melanosporum]